MFYLYNYIDMKSIITFHYTELPFVARPEKENKEHKEKITSEDEGRSGKFMHSK